mgnify:CR=1 FL=1
MLTTTRIFLLAAAAALARDVLDNELVMAHGLVVVVPLKTPHRLKGRTLAWISVLCHLLAFFWLLRHNCIEVQLPWGTASHGLWE